MRKPLQARIDLEGKLLDSDVTNMLGIFNAFNTTEQPHYGALVYILTCQIKQVSYLTSVLDYVESEKTGDDGDNSSARRTAILKTTQDFSGNFHKLPKHLFSK